MSTPGLSQGTAGPLATLVALRVLVAYLGEKDQFGWWSTSFLSVTGRRFLELNFPRTLLSAGVTAASDAAKDLHDQRIGHAGAFHLFRLPHGLEQDVHRYLGAEAAGGLGGLIGGLYLGPFAGIMFLWFIAVIRDQIGEREDRFFATVFFGSGLLFVALLFAASAVASAVVVGYRYLGLDAPTVDQMRLVRSLSYTLLFAFASRAAAVFLLSIATLGLRSRTFPRWLAWTGYLFGIVLLLVVTFWDWIVLLLPAWVAAASGFILRQERARRRAGRAAPG